MSQKYLALAIGAIGFVMVVGVAVIAFANNGTQTQTSMAAPTLKATLVDADNKAKKQEATVEVKVAGISLTDPAKAKEQPKPGEGHIHYQVDDGPVIATTAPKLSFHGLKPGPHKIMVMLAANDHTPLGPQETLNITVP
jgi:hypothetical protein